MIVTPWINHVDGRFVDFVRVFVLLCQPLTNHRRLRRSVRIDTWRPCYGLAVALPSGLSYLVDYVSPTEADELLAAVDAQPWMNDLRRRVQHYGYRYDYLARSVDRSMYLGPLPDWSQPIAKRLQSAAIFGQPPDQLIVNEYEPGQGIAPHVDCVPCFGPVVASLSLGSVCEMEISRDDHKEAIVVRPRSLLVLAGEARASWRHGIRARRSDVYDGARRPRSRRVSLTFRTIRTKDQPDT